MGPLVVLSHGITANSQSFLELIDCLGDAYRLLAIDHRGRGESADIDGPFGLEAHASDIVAVLDFVGAPRAHVHIGHSMGAFIGVVTKALYPERLGHMVLVDGGMPLADELPQGMSAEAVVQAVIGPAMERLDMSFTSVSAYLDFWRAHPAFGDDMTDTLCAYFEADLCGEAPNLRSKVNKTAILGDTESQLMGRLVEESLEQLTAPLHWLTAPRGILDDAALYPDARVDTLLKRYPNLHHKRLDNVNHYDIMLGAAGASQVAEFVVSLNELP